MTVTKNDRQRSEWSDAQRQERLLDALLALLDREDDREQVRSVIEILAEGTGVPLMAMPDDPEAVADFLGGHWTMAIYRAGDDHETRLRLVKMAVGKIRELLAVIEEWESEREFEMLAQEGRFPDSDSYELELPSAGLSTAG